MFTNIATALSRFTLADFVDILIVAFILYSLLFLIKESKAYQMAFGIAFVGLLLLLSQWGKLVVSNWLVRNFVPYLIFTVIVLFQSEIRRLMTNIGRWSFRQPLALRSFQEKIEDLFLAVDYLSLKKIGALIAIEKDISLANFADRGTKIDALLSNLWSASFFLTPRSTTAPSSSRAARSWPPAASCRCRPPIMYAWNFWPGRGIWRPSAFPRRRMPQ